MKIIKFELSGLIISGPITFFALIGLVTENDALVILGWIEMIFSLPLGLFSISIMMWAGLSHNLNEILAFFGFWGGAFLTFIFFNNNCAKLIKKISPEPKESNKSLQSTTERGD